MNLGTATILRADARYLPLADDTVDLVVTSPPYFGLRSYTDAGEHYAGQVGSEPSPQEFLDALLEVTAECARVLKPTGSLWVNLGDKYSDRAGPTWAGSSDRLTGRPDKPRRASSTSMAPRKSLLGLPWRYANRVVDDLGLILREEIVWSKPNGLPESVTDRVRRSHEQWFHFTLAERYFSAVDEIRETYAPGTAERAAAGFSDKRLRAAQNAGHMRYDELREGYETNPLGKLPGSVWTVPTEPLHVPEHLGVDHFAAFPTEWPRRIIRGWCPVGICTACGEPRRPDVHRERAVGMDVAGGIWDKRGKHSNITGRQHGEHSLHTITGYACACPDASADTTPAVVLDPFGGTGTVAMVAKALGRHGITVDLSADYCRLAEWRTNNRDQLAKVLGIPKLKDSDVGDDDLLGLLEAGA